MQEVIEILKTKLPEYLMFHGRDYKKGNFQCLQPEKHANNDRRASMGLVPQTGNTVAHCFTCSLNVNIFGAAHILEGLPINGQEFFTVTVPTLAKRFGIDIEENTLTEEEQFILTLYEAYKDMERYCIDNLTNNQYAIEEITRRGWKVEICKQLGCVGAVKSYDDYINYMENLGWSKDFLKRTDVDLFRQSLFNDNKLIFLVKDEFNRTVGVASRIIGDKRDDSNVEKYVNTRTTPIYKKHEILFNLYNIVKGSSIYVFEGYADVLTAMHYGIYNCVATGGVAFTEEHIKALERKNVSEIILAFDNDSGGRKGSRSVINLFNSVKTNINLLLIDYKTVPEKYTDVTTDDIQSLDDPDKIISKYGGEFFTSFRSIQPFEWLLMNIPYNYEKPKIIKEMIDLIMQNRSPLERANMARILSQHTGEPLNIIMEEIRYRENLLNAQYQEEVRSIAMETINNLRKGANAVITILTAADKIKRLNLDETKNFNEKYTKDIKEVYDKIVSKKDLTGFKLGSLDILESKMDGFTKDGALILLGAEPHFGKTSFLRYLSYQLVISNPNVCVVYFSLEDNKFKMIPAFISIINKFRLRDVMNPNKYLDNEQLARFKAGFDLITKLKEEKRLYILDAQYGTTFRAMESIIDDIKRLSNRDIVVIIDHFYKITDNSNLGMREKIIHNIERLQLMASIYNVPIFSVVELNKLPPGARPDITNITETGRIAYEADVVMLMYNELLSLRNNISSVQLKWFDENTLAYKPIIELSIVKNKLTGWSGPLYYKYDNEYNIFEQLDNIEIEKLQETEDSEYETAEF